jgi:hypothetical protein
MNCAYVGLLHPTEKVVGVKAFNRSGLPCKFCFITVVANCQPKQSVIVTFVVIWEEVLSVTVHTSRANSFVGVFFNIAIGTLKEASISLMYFR